MRARYSRIWQRFACAVGRHPHTLIERRGREIFLRCQDCNRRSPGWLIRPVKREAPHARSEHV